MTKQNCCHNNLLEPIRECGSCVHKHDSLQPMLFVSYSKEKCLLFFCDVGEDAYFDCYLFVQRGFFVFYQFSGPYDAEFFAFFFLATGT